MILEAARSVTGLAAGRKVEGRAKDGSRGPRVVDRALRQFTAKVSGEEVDWKYRRDFEV